ncbi:UPAR/Ly6 domain-containing protein crok [Procambarus clarkii]|uniref:UPAR/Ly6 domain-containing protein crok n=1 Tax=Procambarus clarkii TaxID=6728 RepID=UPI0037425A88
MTQKAPLLALLLVLSSVWESNAIKCFQCSTDEDPDGKDLCGAYEKFDETAHIPVDCFQEESVTPGTFCVKITKQSPRMFIWDGRWRTVIRRCSSVTETGVTNICNWGVDPIGVYWEECYCTSDGCNGTSTISASFLVVFAAAFALILLRKQ